MLGPPAASAPGSTMEDADVGGRLRCLAELLSDFSATLELRSKLPQLDTADEDTTPPLSAQWATLLLRALDCGGTDLLLRLRQVRGDVLTPACVQLMVRDRCFGCP